MEASGRGCNSHNVPRNLTPPTFPAWASKHKQRDSVLLIWATLKHHAERALSLFRHVVAMLLHLKAMLPHLLQIMLSAFIIRR
eukprot:7398849-Alexandrium_andersonii.AAC.1